MSDRDTLEHSPTTPAGENYLDAVLESLLEAFEEECNGGDELAINTQCLCVDLITKPETFEHYDEETGEAHLLDTGLDEVVGHKFVVTTGGPHAEFRTLDSGVTWSFFYCEWFGSEEYKTEIHADAMEAFQVYFECGVEEGSQLGALI